MVHTSGSTGVPKRVLNTHGGLRNLLLWMQSNYRLDARDRVLHHTPVTFDASLAEIKDFICREFLLAWPHDSDAS